MSDLTLAEAKKALVTLRSSIGEDVYISLDLAANHPELLTGTIYPEGITHSKPLYVRGDTYTEVINGLHAAWVNYRDQHITGKVRAMAVKIMTITADTGSCTAAALRMGHDFTDADIATYGDKACEEATRIAGSGPFVIIPTSSNQVAAE